MEPTRPSDPPSLTALRAAFADAARRSCVWAPLFALLLRLLETLSRMLADFDPNAAPAVAPPPRAPRRRQLRPRPVRRRPLPVRKLHRAAATALLCLACAFAPAPVLIPVPLRPSRRPWPRDIRR